MAVSSSTNVSWSRKSSVFEFQIRVLEEVESTHHHNDQRVSSGFFTEFWIATLGCSTEVVRFQMQKKYSFGLTILHSRIVRDMHEWKSYFENASFEGGLGPRVV